MQETQDKAQAATERQKIARRRRELEQEQALAAAQLDALQLKTATLEEEINALASDEQARLLAAAHEQAELARARGENGIRDTPKKGSKTHGNKRKNS